MFLGQDLIFFIICFFKFYFPETNFPTFETRKNIKWLISSQDLSTMKTPWRPSPSPRRTSGIFPEFFLFKALFFKIFLIIFLVKSNLIHPDAIREGKSLEQLRTMKGHEGLSNMLKVNLKVFSQIKKIIFFFSWFFGFFLSFKKCISYEFKNENFNLFIIFNVLGLLVLHFLPEIFKKSPRLINLAILKFQLHHLIFLYKFLNI